MGRKQGKGHSLKKNLPVNSEEPKEIVQAPHSFVIHRGLPCLYVRELALDFRRIMEPFTAVNLKERKSNKIKDFVSLSGIFHVSHLCIFNKATSQLSFKVIRLPRGPTLTFKIHQFTLARDVIASSKKQFIDDEIFHHAPLVILNNFTGEGKHMKLMAATFQNMFPTINLATVNLGTVRRCVLFSYNPVAKLIDMRHYSIIVVPVGLSRGVKKVVLGKIPNLSRCDDIGDFITQGTMMSDSEAEDDEANHVVLAQTLRRKGNLENNKSAVRLYEIGPRLTFELVKIEDSLLTGEVLYHETIVKTEEEIEAIRKLREKKKKLKEQRKKQQSENKAKKDKLKVRGKKETHEEPEVEPDDDAQYYKDEVGEDPDEELFKPSSENPRKRVRVPKHLVSKDAKKKKLEKKDDYEKKSKTNKTGKSQHEKFGKERHRKGTNKSIKKKGTKGVTFKTNKKKFNKR